LKTIGVIANCGKPRARPALARLAEAAKACGLKLVAAPPTLRYLPGARAVRLERIGRSCDALVALGGDGTMLLAARLIHASDTPLLGVNLGKLGFLTSVPEADIEQALKQLAAGRYRCSERTVAECSLVRRGKKVGQYRALNDIVVGWGQSSRIVTFDVSIRGELITSYRCDGIILSTPTGSTGHSLSAGGPILHPETGVFLLNVICPHALSARSIVLPDRSEIEIVATHSQKSLLLSVDGQEERRVEQGDRLLIRRSPKSVGFIHLPGYSYFSILRGKLEWKGSSVGNGP
jgi:NAD+ kinase